ncbi:Tar ligand binding domain-containing protein, partial [Cronobacter sakazakii]|uniref:Tar ligand binding domain-containing protein n=1 Tax=Cronobacter sakazakii TaxID=28141 RepID=UPI00289539C4
SQQARQSLESAREVLGKADGAFNKYLSAPKQAGEATLVESYRRNWQTYRDQGLRPLLDAVARNDNTSYVQLVTNTLPQLDRQFEVSLDQLLAFREDYAHKQNEDVQASFVTGLMLIGFFALLFLGLIAVIFALLKRRVLKPLDAARAHCLEMAAGDLHTPVLSKTKDEIGEMLRALENMRLSLTQILGQVRESSQTVAFASEEIAAGNTDLSARTEEQAASLGETAASMEQLTATVKQTSSNA